MLSNSQLKDPQSFCLFLQLKSLILESFPLTVQFSQSVFPSVTQSITPIERLTPPVSLAEVHTAAACAPSDWIWSSPLTRSQRLRKNWAHQSDPCTMRNCRDVDSSTIPTCLCRRDPSRCTWTASVPIGCEYCNGPPLVNFRRI